MDVASHVGGEFVVLVAFGGDLSDGAHVGGIGAEGPDCVLGGSHFGAVDQK